MDSETVFIQVGALAKGLIPDNNRLPQLNHLSGKTFIFNFVEGDLAHLKFEDDQTLYWNESLVSYRATSIREKITFIDFLNPELENASITLVCNEQAQNFIAIYGALPSLEETKLSAFSRVESGLPLSSVNTKIRFGWLNQTMGVLPQFTEELIGLRNLYIYSPTEAYEHIYLNQDYYVWHCLKGVEKGLADVDRCFYIKVDEKLYLFIWKEKVIPTLGILLIDQMSQRTDGKLFGYQESDFSQLSNFAVGAQLKRLNLTDYPLSPITS